MSLPFSKSATMNEKTLIKGIQLAGQKQDKDFVTSLHKEVTKKLEIIENLEKQRELLNSISKTYFSNCCLLYTSPSPRDATLSRMPSSA